MHEVALSVGSFNHLNRLGQQPSWPTGHRPRLPLGTRTLALAPCVRPERVEEGTASRSLTLSRSLSVPRLALALSLP